jgi:hypothetical protein
MVLTNKFLLSLKNELLKINTKNKTYMASFRNYNVKKKNKAFFYNQFILLSNLKKKIVFKCKIKWFKIKKKYLFFYKILKIESDNHIF